MSHALAAVRHRARRARVSQNSKPITLNSKRLYPAENGAKDHRRDDDNRKY
jgi:hypothetical protein